MLYDARRAQEMARRLLAYGVLATGFFFPVVPQGRARIRTQMSAALSIPDLDEALAAFEAAGRETGAIP
jgi:glycine C-acetyltransferase